MTIYKSVDEFELRGKGTVLIISEFEGDVPIIGQTVTVNDILYKVLGVEKGRCNLLGGRSARYSFLVERVYK